MTEPTEPTEPRKRQGDPLRTQLAPTSQPNVCRSCYVIPVVSSHPTGASRTWRVECAHCFETVDGINRATAVGLWNATKAKVPSTSDEFRCGHCGEIFDRGSLDAVLYHANEPHRPILATGIRGERIS